MPENIDCIVVGAGVIGLAAARRLAAAGLQTVVLEAESRIGMHTSSRNSEVIHAGIYYAGNSLKARLCVQGRDLLYAYCAARRVPHARIGKLILATSAEEESKLVAIEARALASGVGDLQWFDAGGVAALEPAVRASSALLSPSTGIVDSHALLASLQADLESAGGLVLCRQSVTAVRAEGDGFRVRTADMSDDGVRCRYLVNAAGLWASDVARTIDGLDPGHVPETSYAKGHYYGYAGRSPFSHLIYPVPVEGGLGIHVTLDLSGAARFGPDVAWLGTVDYGFDDGRRQAFADAIRRYFPDLDPARLRPAYTGIRPKLGGPAADPADFIVQGPAEHSVPGLVNLYGIESPGLTASLAIGELVYEKLLAPG